jgi:hypothetical protein
MTLDEIKAELAAAQGESNRIWEEWIAASKRSGELYDQLRREQVRAELLAEQAGKGDK